MEKAERRNAQVKARDTLLRIVDADPEWVVRYAAVTGLQGVAVAADHEGYGGLIAPIAACLRNLVVSDDALVVQARADWAIAQLPAQIST